MRTVVYNLENGQKEISYARAKAIAHTVSLENVPEAPVKLTEKQKAMRVVAK